MTNQTDKNMIPKHFILAAVLLFGVGNTVLQAQSQMYIYEKSGLFYSHTLSDIQKLTFSSGSMMVFENNGDYADYGLVNIHYLSFREMPVALPDEYNENSTTTHYPNPVTDRLTISYTLPGAMNVKVAVMDMQGRVLWQQTVDGQNGINLTIIPVTELSAGLYLCRLQSGDNLECIKFFKF
jgi:hypothetical protein